MLKPFFNRKYEPQSIGEDNDWVFWRWFDITGTEGEGVYLRRLYLLRCPWFSVMVHRIKRPDQDRHLHDHPWDFVSVVLRGWYEEVRPYGHDVNVWAHHARWWFNRCRAEDAHKIVYVSPTCTTLVITGPKRRSWGFHTERGWVSWQRYLVQGKREPAPRRPIPPYQFSFGDE